MKTVLTTSPEKAAEFIKCGGIVAFPTETVYGLGANVFNEKAVAEIFEAKRRPTDNPLIAHITNRKQISELVIDVSLKAGLLIGRFFPGPLTLVLKKTKRVPLISTAGLDTVGIRMPGNKLAQEFLLACDVPVVAPSANLSGRPSPTTWQAVAEDLDGRIDCILQGEATEIGLESTVVDCTSDVPILLRPGSISLDELRSVVPETISYVANEDISPRSPGMKHTHYSPQARVVVVENPCLLSLSALTGKAAYIGLTSPETQSLPLPVLTRVCDSVEEYAHALFEFFRECDRLGIATIYCEKVPEAGIGAALMDRLRRAAEGEKIGHD